MKASGKKSGSIRRHVNEIRKYGVGIVPRKLTMGFRQLQPWNLIFGIWAVPLVLLIRIMRPLILIRMGTLFSSRIGHFVADGAEQVARLQQQPINTVDWFWLGKTCNSQWEIMIRRVIPVYSWVKYLDWWNRAIPGGAAHTRPSSYTQSRDVEGLYARYDVAIPFLPTETEEALSWLRSQGWCDGEPFVCLLVRDDEFLANSPRHGNGSLRSREAWSYHDYRNSNIDTYLPAIRWLSEQGVWVIRMGKLMAKPLPDGMVRVIDYAFKSDKSDLLDIWLFANCSGCISTATGPDMIPLVYDRPLLFVNALPLGSFTSFARSIWVPKILKWKEDVRPLSLKENILNSFLHSSEYDLAGIEIIDLTPSQITSAVKEFWQRCTGSSQDTPEDDLSQHEFWDTCMA